MGTEKANTAVGCMTSNGGPLLVWDKCGLSEYHFHSYSSRNAPGVH